MHSGLAFVRRGEPWSGLAKDTTLVVMVMQLCATWTLAVANPEIRLGRQQHAQGWRREIDPKRVPVSAVDGRAECPGWICAHAG